MKVMKGNVKIKVNILHSVKKQTYFSNNQIKYDCKIIHYNQKTKN